VTWPDGIATAILTAFALLITLHQHRSTTEQDPQDGEQP
jgi:hypothetical protein